MFDVRLMVTLTSVLLSLHPVMFCCCCFAVNKQHDADEVFLSVLNFLLQQMDDATLVGLLPASLFSQWSVFAVLKGPVCKAWTELPL